MNVVIGIVLGMLLTLGYVWCLMSASKRKPSELDKPNL